MIKDGGEKKHEINKNKLCQISLQLFFGLQPLQRSFLKKNQRNCPKYKVLEVDLLYLEHLFLQIVKQYQKFKNILLSYLSCCQNLTRSSCGWFASVMTPQK